MYLSNPNAFSQYLTEKELTKYYEICEAMEMLETKNYTPQQIRGYELYIDNIRTYVTEMSASRRLGLEEGLAQGRAEAKTGIMDNVISILHELKKGNLTTTEIAEKFNVSEKYVDQLKESIS